MPRTAGILLHPTSLPTPFPIGDIGPSAFRFVAWLADAGAAWWQILPLCPPGPGFSPYSGVSTFAGSPYLISPELLVEGGLLDPEDLMLLPDHPPGSIDVDAAVLGKDALLRRAWKRFNAGAFPDLRKGFDAFVQQNHWWLEDFCLFTAVKERHGGVPWYEWPRSLAMREPDALSEATRRLEDEIGWRRFAQFLFFDQWSRLKATANDHGISLLGDLPIYVADDSVEVWAHPELFRLDEHHRPTAVAGVPPDYFSETGQLWGNPLYDWDRHAEDGFSWWIARTLHALDLVDALRLDHFRGFAAFWEVPAGDRTAVSGRWVPGPGRRLFDALQAAVGSLPFIAEDLGEITPEVVALRKDLKLPGMAVLHFGFSPEPRSSFIPYRLERDLVVYTGTHDNNTTRGWYEEDASPGERDLVRRYTQSDGSDIHWRLIVEALASVADTAIVPFQDLLGLGADARMNLPGQAEGNWTFALSDEALDPALAARFRNLVDTYGRRENGSR